MGGATAHQGHQEGETHNSAPEKGDEEEPYYKYRCDYPLHYLLPWPNWVERYWLKGGMANMMVREDSMAFSGKIERWWRATALAAPGFPILLLGQVVALQGTWIQGPAQRWLMLELTGSPWMVGLLGGVGGLPILLFAFAGGWLADRLPRITVLLACHFIIAFQGCLLGILISSGAIAPGHLLILGFLLGCAMAAEVPARQALVFDLVGRERITNALGLHSTAFNLARFAGPAVAGWLMAAGFLDWCFYIRGVTAGFAALCLTAIRVRYGPPSSRGRRPSPSLVEALRSSISYIAKNPNLSWVLLLILCFGGFLLPYSILLPSLGKEVLGLGPKEYGYLCASNGLGALLGAISVALFGHMGERRRWWLTGSLLFPISLMAVGWAPGYHWSMAALFFSGIVMVVTSTSALSLVQLEAPDHIRGQLMGLFTTSFMGLFPLGSVVQGWVAEWIGVRECIWVFGAAATLASAAAAIRFGRGRKGA